MKTVLHFVHGFIEFLEAMGILACGYLPAKMGFHFPRDIQELAHHSAGATSALMSVSARLLPPKGPNKIPGIGSVTAKQGAGLQWERMTSGNFKISVVTVNRTGSWEFIDRSAFLGQVAKIEKRPENGDVSPGSA